MKPQSIPEDKSCSQFNKITEALAGWAVTLGFVAIAAFIEWIVWFITGLFISTLPRLFPVALSQIGDRVARVRV